MIWKFKLIFFHGIRPHWILKVPCYSYRKQHYCASGQISSFNCYRKWESLMCNKTQVKICCFFNTVLTCARLLFYSQRSYNNTIPIEHWIAILDRYLKNSEFKIPLKINFSITFSWISVFKTVSKLYSKPSVKHWLACKVKHMSPWIKLM